MRHHTGMEVVLLVGLRITRKTPVADGCYPEVQHGKHQVAQCVMASSKIPRPAIGTLHGNVIWNTLMIGKQCQRVCIIPVIRIFVPRGTKQPRRNKPSQIMMKPRSVWSSPSLRVHCMTRASLMIILVSCCYTGRASL